MPTEKQIVLEYSDVCFAYEKAEVLHNVQLQIRSGSLVAVVGPNGGGKSTLIRLGLGLLSPKRGRICVFGDNPVLVRRHIGYVPQHLSFDAAFPVSALDVVLMGRAERHRFGFYRKKDRTCAMDAMEKVGTAALASRPFSQLSGGERQRVLIAQALASEPKLLLLDEPTANVDTEVEQQIYRLLKELNREMTIVIVSHNLNVVTRHASDVVCVNRTVSQVSTKDWSADKMRAVYHGDLAVLQHGMSCQVIDPSEGLREPHHASLTSDIGDAL
ncbi:MAG: ABC transporter ATP-binding protein [Spartobacteria bacterium]|nr:ABC transporter ATP-binding protein [Spartobacteria bacterium]